MKVPKAITSSFVFIWSAVFLPTQSYSAEPLCVESTKMAGGSQAYAEGFCREHEGSRLFWKCIKEALIQSDRIGGAEKDVVSAIGFAQGYGACALNAFEIRGGAMVSRDRERMRRALSDQVVYSMTKVNVENGEYGDVFVITDVGNVAALNKEYEGEYYDTEFDNGERQWNVRKMLIDTYYSAKIGGETYYIRAEDVIWR